jgi:hypothetical protein
MKATKSLLGRAAAVAGAFAVATGGLVAVAAPAQAAPLGTITLAPSSGTVDQNPFVTAATTSAPCPAGYGDFAALRIGPVGGAVTNLNRIASAGGYDIAPFSLAAGWSLTAAFSADPAVKPAPGDYVVVIECINALGGANPNRFETLITITGTDWRLKSAPAPVTPTTTTLVASPAGPVVTGTAVTLTATVAPAAAGSVDFRVGGTSLGTAPVSGGTASITTSTLPAGSNTVTAAFTPTDPAAYGASSGNVAIQVNAPGSISKQQRITASIIGGGLSLAVAGTDVALAGGVIGGTATGTLNKATVTDQRGTNTGWNLTGQVENFIGPSAAVINGNQLGWAPNANKVSGSGTVTAGAAATPGAGLGSTKTLCSAARGGSAGVFECGAGLTLGIPDTTAPGSYTATLTLTLV